MLREVQGREVPEMEEKSQVVRSPAVLLLVFQEEIKRRLERVNASG
jgi:hypothetical protein